jgi:vancomycin permeability regulator SanA
VKLRRPRPRRRTVAVLGALAVLSAAVVFGPSGYLRIATARHRFTLAAAPSAPVAIVLGAGVHGGQPSPFLARRLDLAIELYAGGRVRGLLMSGDNSRSDYDEVGVMAAYAVAHGVPADVVAQDHAGFDTYASCYRARALFGVRRAVLVTQSFHVARAVFVCRHVGVDAAGVGDDTSRRWPMPTRRAQIRELFSSTKALWETEVTRPEPHFLGPHEPALDAVLAGG